MSKAKAEYIMAPDGASLTCARCGSETEALSADWEECGECEQARDDWEANTPEWVKLGMSSMWDGC